MQAEYKRISHDMGSWCRGIESLLRERMKILGERETRRLGPESRQHIIVLCLGCCMTRSNNTNAWEGKVYALCSIDYGEFLAATVNLSQLEKEENMFKAFQFFDKDSSGYITKDELEEALKVKMRKCMGVQRDHWLRLHSWESRLAVLT